MQPEILAEKRHADDRIGFQKRIERRLLDVELAEVKGLARRSTDRFERFGKADLSQCKRPEMTEWIVAGAAEQHMGCPCAAAAATLGVGAALAEAPEFGRPLCFLLPQF